MAHTTDNAVNRQLLFELRKAFPDVPDSVIVSTLQQYRNSHDICFDVIRKERHKYAYGPFESAAPSGQFQHLRLKDDRGRGLSQPGIEMHPDPNMGYMEPSYSGGMTHSRSEPHLLLDTPHSPTHLGRPPETSAAPVYYTNYSQAMRQHPAPPPPIIPFTSSHGQGNYMNDSRFRFAQQQQQQPPPYSVSVMPTCQGYNVNGANYNISGASDPSTSSQGLTDWTRTSPVSTRGDPQRPSSPFVNYASPGSPYTSPRQETHIRKENQNFPHSVSQPSLRPLYIDTSNQLQNRQFLNTANPTYVPVSPHNSRSQSPVVHNPLQLTMPQQPYHGLPPQQGAHTPGSDPGTPPVYFPPAGGQGQNVFFQTTQSYRPPTNDSDQSLLMSNDPHVTLVHQQPMQPILSPSSSLSSLCSDIEGRSSRSNSTDDIAYTQALILHQKARKEKIEKEVERINSIRDRVRTEVWAMENEVSKRKSNRNKDFSVTPDELVRLRESNRRLQVDIQLMYREVDLYESGQAPPSMNEQMNFYSNMSTTGQSGRLRAPPTGVLESIASVQRLPVVPQEQNTQDDEQWPCSACTFLNHPALNKCECCEMPRSEQGTTAVPPSGSMYPHH